MQIPNVVGHISRVETPFDHFGRTEGKNMTSKVACCFFIWTRMGLNEMWLKNIQEITSNKCLKLRFGMFLEYLFKLDKTIKILMIYDSMIFSDC